MLRDTSSWPGEYLEEGKALVSKTLTPDLNARAQHPTAQPAALRLHDFFFFPSYNVSKRLTESTYGQRI
jgi:hypothetical protein